MAPILAARIIVAGGDSATQTILRFLLEDDGYTVHTYAALGIPAAVLPGCAAIIAIVSPLHAGTSDIALTALQQSAPTCPLLVLMRGNTPQHRRQALALGARDVISLPASPCDLQARLRAALRTQTPAARVPRHREAEVVRAGGLTLRLATRDLADDTGWRAVLTPRETALLAELMRHPGRRRGRHDLLDAVWGEAYEGVGNALAMAIHRLRAKLARPTSATIPVRTLWGDGYTFDARVTPRPAAPPPLSVSNDRGS